MHSIEWLAFSFNQIIRSQKSCFMTRSENNLRVGVNAVANRLKVVNGKIPLDWLNLGSNLYKIKCKEIFLIFKANAQ